MVFVHHSFFSNLSFFFLSHEISPRAEKNLHIDLDIRSSSMFTINEKRHIKNLFHTINFFLIPLKKIGIKKKTNSPTTQSTNNPIHSTKNLPHLKETRHRKSPRKKNGEKIRDCISSSH